MSELHKLYRFTKVMHHDVYPSISPSNPDLSVTGQTILVSGGGSGIGLATAKAFAQAGAKTIIIVGRRSTKLEEGRTALLATNPQTNILTFTADVASKESVSALWDKIDDAKLRIDVLVNNAGVSVMGSPIGKTDPDQWWQVQQINLLGTYLMVYGYIALLDKWADNDRATIINVSSQVGVSSFPGSSSYAVAKLGMAKLSDMIHAEYPNIRSFAIHPGIIYTDMSVGSPIAPHSIDTVDLAGGYMLYLASPRADYLRGRYSTANWDVDEMEAHKDEITAGQMLKIGLIVEYGLEGHEW